jgi:hypothetical protein
MLFKVGTVLDNPAMARMIMHVESLACRLCDQGDEFVPFEHTTVSKYGPISRGRAKERLKIVPPVNVTAGQKVGAVASLQWEIQC